MPKIHRTISFLLFFILMDYKNFAQGNHNLLIKAVDKDENFLYSTLGLEKTFFSQSECGLYISKLPGLLQTKGYVTASVDSITYDSMTTKVVLFVGNQYRWAQLNTDSIDGNVLDALGWQPKLFTDKPMDFSQVNDWQERLLNYFENNGHPFATIFLDSFRIDSSNNVTGALKVNKGPAYVIDSIRVFGDAKISNRFLQRYLDITNGSPFSKEKLLRISKRILELNYIKEEKRHDISYLGSGSVLNLYLTQRKSSQVNVLIGFLPNNDQLSSKKILITGEANINLKNAFGNGETIGLNWQQLQVKSPRLNLLYQHPYIFNSQAGLDFAFDIFRKDSTFLNINFNIGAQYAFSTTQSGKLFLRRFQTIATPNTASVLTFRQLPPEADVSSTDIGIDYEINKTDYRLNPLKGAEFRMISSVGIKKIKKNNLILELKDPSDPGFDFNKLYDTLKLKTYRLKFNVTAARYFPLGRQSTLRTAFNGGLFQSGNFFRNELFQIGGYKLLRGFDEESQYLSQYGIATLEYRYRVGLNSFFYVFTDGGWGKNAGIINKPTYTYLGTGLGLAFETKAGILNLAWAIGKRNDTDFNLRQSKIHFGFINYF
jgi:outer membrane protein assembly factor BamA